MPLHVHVTLEPLPDEMSREELDRVLSGEIASFEKWYRERSKGSTTVPDTALTTIERTAVKAYILYAHSQTEK